MSFYAGIDLHSNNNVLVVIDDKERVLYRKRLRNELPMVIEALQPFEQELLGVVVESTYNWYWLVDGLMDASRATVAGFPGCGSLPATISAGINAAAASGGAVPLR